MRIKINRMLSIFGLIFFFQFGLLGCSGQQQQGYENLEVSEQNEQGEEGNQENGNQQENGQEGNEQGNQEGDQEGNQEGNQEGDEMTNQENLEGEEGEELAEENAVEGEEGLEGEEVAEGNEGLENVISQMADQGAEGAELVDQAPEGEATEEMAEAAPDEAQMDAADVAAEGATSAMASVLPEPGTKMPYIVQTGDTLGSIAQRIYGERSKWSEISQLSSLSNPNRIYAGDVVYYQLDDTTTAFAQAYEAAPRSEITVNPGDTLATIASRVLGSSQHWKAMWRENQKISNPDVLEVGSTIYFLNPSALQASINSVNNKLSAVAQNAASKTLDQAEQLDSADQFSVDNSSFEFVGTFVSTPTNAGFNG